MYIGLKNQEPKVYEVFKVKETNLDYIFETQKIKGIQNSYEIYWKISRKYTKSIKEYLYAKSKNGIDWTIYRKEDNTEKKFGYIKVKGKQRVAKLLIGMEKYNKSFTSKTNKDKND